MAKTIKAASLTGAGLLSVIPLIIKWGPVIVKWWPVFVLIAKLIGAGRPLLEELTNRPDTDLPEDVREFMRKAGTRGTWQDEFWKQQQEDSG